LDATATFTQRYVNLGRGYTPSAPVAHPDDFDSFMSPIQRQMTQAARIYSQTASQAPSQAPSHYTQDPLNIALSQITPRSPQPTPGITSRSMTIAISPPVVSTPAPPAPTPAPPALLAAQPLNDFVPFNQAQNMQHNEQMQNDNYRTPIRNRVDRNISYPRIDRYTERQHRNGNAPYHRRYYPHNNRYFNQTPHFNPMTGLPYSNNYNNNDRPYRPYYNRNNFNQNRTFSPRRVTFHENSSSSENPSNYNNYNN
jgi:hypothetical protein